ncbi:MAG: hypothetical protein ACN0LA_01550 [Candidatus Longimicrobiales bacterium M2_2A_002]
MRTGTPWSRPRPRSLRSGAFFIALVAVVGAGVLLAPADAAGQEPDTVPARDVRERRQEERAEPDSAAQDTVAVDTVQPPPTFLPPLGDTTAAGWARGVWEWDRQDLLRLPDLSLLDLLERIPGLVPVRADIGGQPEGGAVFGAAAGAIRYVVDGFVLDPLTAPTFDPSRYSLLALERVRVERRVTGMTVRVETLTPDDARTKSVIEAGTGDYEINLFRGMFLPPRVLGGPLGLGFERLSVVGFTPGSSNHNTSWLKWTWARESGGVQVEYRQSTLDRSGVGPPLQGSRSDWVVRARKAVGPVTAEAYVGGTSMEDEIGSDTALTVLREGSSQGGLRLGLTAPGPVPAWLRTAVRFRSHPRLPSQELELRAGATPLPWLSLEGEVLQGRWDEGPDGTGRWSARAAVGPLVGLTAFGEAFGSGALVGSGPGLALPSPTDSAGLRVSRDGYRVGLELVRGGLRLGGAAVQLSADTVYGFGLPSEEQWLALPGGDAQGFEVSGRIPVGIDPFSIQGWYVGMDAPAGWLYLPEEHWRLGLVYHHLPLPSGNLEIFGRIERVFRGPMYVPGPAGEPSATQVAPAYETTDLELTIRVLSVRAFVRWSNMLPQIDRADLPAYPLPGQNILWGVKWEFWN